jgi:hypothetical protein
LVIGWPPSVKLVRTPGHEEEEKKTLHGLFVWLEDKRLLRHGYGTRAGITDLEDLRGRVDDIRGRLVPAVAELSPEASIADWLRKLNDACDELLNYASEAIGATEETARNPEPSVVAPAVDQLRQAFRLVADHVGALYELPAAKHLADRIGADTVAPPTQ